MKIHHLDGTEELEALSENKDIVRVDSISSIDEKGEADISLLSTFAGTTVLTVQISGTEIRRNIRITVGHPSYEEAFGPDKNILKLPDLLSGIEAEAFYGNSQIEAVLLPKDVRSIGENAFGNCSNLKAVWIPEGLEAISDTAFSDSANVIIYCPANSPAAAWADRLGIPMVNTSN